MYFLTGYSNIIKSVYALSSSYTKGIKPKVVQDLKQPYRNFLVYFHKDSYINFSENKFETNPKSLENLRSRFMVKTTINDLEQENLLALHIDKNQQDWRIDSVVKAIDGIKKLSPELGEIFELCIHSIIISDSKRNNFGQRAHGGSTSNCIGLIWLTILAQLNHQDIMEILIHELTHTLVFIDELNHKHFIYQDIAKKYTWAQSAILDKNRPMDKVIHSIIVATEILYARKLLFSNTHKFNVHPESSLIKESLLASIKSVKEHPHLHKICQPRAISLTLMAEEAVLKLNDSKANRYA